MPKLTKKEIEVICRHLETVISWGAEGSFNRENYEGDFVIDKREIKIAHSAINKLRRF